MRKKTTQKTTRVNPAMEQDVQKRDALEAACAALAKGKWDLAIWHAYKARPSAQAFAVEAHALEMGKASAGAGCKVLVHICGPMDFVDDDDAYARVTLLGPGGEPLKGWYMTEEELDAGVSVEQMWSKYMTWRDWRVA